VPIVLKSGSLILLEPSGPEQARNEIPLPFPELDVYTVTTQVTLSLIFLHGVSTRAEISS